MSTLNYTDTVQRTGHTIIDGKKVVQYNCTIPLASPKDMRITSAKLDMQMYKDNREICRNDMAEFEDLAYALQEEYLAKAEY